MCFRLSLRSRNPSDSSKKLTPQNTSTSSPVSTLNTKVSTNSKKTSTEDSFKAARTTIAPQRHSEDCSELSKRYSTGCCIDGQCVAPAHCVPFKEAKERDKRSGRNWGNNRGKNRQNRRRVKPPDPKNEGNGPGSPDGGAASGSGGSPWPWWAIVLLIVDCVIVLGCLLGGMQAFLDSL